MSHFRPSSPEFKGFFTTFISLIGQSNTGSVKTTAQVAVICLLERTSECHFENMLKQIKIVVMTKYNIDAGEAISSNSKRT